MESRSIISLYVSMRRILLIIAKETLLRALSLKMLNFKCIPLRWRVKERISKFGRGRKNDNEN